MKQTEYTNYKSLQYNELTKHTRSFYSANLAALGSLGKC